MSRTHYLSPPLSEAAVRALKAGDQVVLDGLLYGIRDATQIALFDHGRTTRFDLAGQVVIHTAPNVRRLGNGFEPVSVGTTTSARMERFTRPLMERLGVRVIIGKGGLSEDSLAAFNELGGVYLAVNGGCAAIETTWIEQIDDVDLLDLDPECLWRFIVRGFGPLLVAMDSHGRSLYEERRRAVVERRDAVLTDLGIVP